MLQQCPTDSVLALLLLPKEKERENQIAEVNLRQNPSLAIAGNGETKVSAQKGILAPGEQHTPLKNRELEVTLAKQKAEDDPLAQEEKDQEKAKTDLNLRSPFPKRERFEVSPHLGNETHLHASISF